MDSRIPNKGCCIGVIGELMDLNDYAARTAVIEVEKIDRPIPDIMTDHGFDPADWVVVKSNIKVGKNGWVKIELTPVMVRPAALTPGKVWPKWDPAIHTQAVSKGVVLSDHQISHHDRDLHRLACEFISEFEPDFIILNGDFLDNPTISRWPANPGYDMPFQECVNQGYEVLTDYLTAAGADKRPVRRVLMEGNHDKRPNDYLQGHAPEFINLRRGGDDEGTHPVNSIPYLLRLDELGVEWLGGWPHTQLVLSPHLAVRHGWLVKPKSGATALATLERLGHSVIVGHVHRQAIVCHTIRDINGHPSVLVAVEGGTMATVDLGYDPAQNAQQGFTVVHMFDDGDYSVSLAQYDKGKLFWSGNRWS